MSEEMTCREAGKLGGKKLAEKHAGTDYYHRIGKKGGMEVIKKHGKEHFSRIGKMGGAATAEKHGADHYVAIGKKALAEAGEV